MSDQILLSRSSRTEPVTDDLIAKAEKTLSDLEEMDARYQRERDAIEMWPVSDRSKQRMLGRLQAERQAKREAIVERMLELRRLLAQRTHGQRP
jgi:hypothetical protein